jgi:hypothetical protein
MLTNEIGSIGQLPADRKGCASKLRWLEEELRGCEFNDKRLKDRFYHLSERLWSNIGETIPYACQDWSATKAAYRFLSNERFNEYQLLTGHFDNTQRRFSNANGKILVLHDTTGFAYHRNKADSVGVMHVLNQGVSKQGNPKRYVQRGILMHSSLVVTPEGLPLGLAAIKFWTRKRFKGTNALKKHINPTRMPIDKKESYRWLENMIQSTQQLNDPDRCVHVGDRESDIYELFCTAKQLKTHFLVRTCVDRLAGDGTYTVERAMDRIKIKGLHQIEVRDKQGNRHVALLQIKYERICMLPPIGKQKAYPELWLTVIHAIEQGNPTNRAKICWKLLTDLEVNRCQDAIEKLHWYAKRWHIETFHKILKSGCQAESSKLRTATRLTKLLAIFCIIGWRIFWATILNRLSKHISPCFALTKVEIDVLNHYKPEKNRSKQNYLSDYLTKIAKLGGYLARASDPPPGNMVMWKGMTRLADIMLGFKMACELMGN